VVAVASTDYGREASGAPLRVLYIGPNAHEIRSIVEKHEHRILASYTGSVEDALFLSRNFIFDAVIVDQRDSGLATRLIMPLMACFSTPVNLVVISALSAAEAYKRVPGVARLLPVPVREQGLLRSLGLANAKPKQTLAEKSAQDEEKKFAELPPGTAPIAPRRKARQRKLRSVGWNFVGWQKTAAAGALVATAIVATWFVTAGRDKSMATVAAPQMSETGHVRTILLERIERAKAERLAATEALTRSRKEADIILNKVNRFIAETSAPAEKIRIELGALERSAKRAEKTKTWRRSVAELRERQKLGLMDEASVKLNIARLLKDDENLQGLRKRKAKVIAQGAEYELRLQVLSALARNLSGTRTALPKTVPPDMLPLVKEAAVAVKAVTHDRGNLDAAERMLEIFEQKGKSNKDQAALQ
jgi:hypothetical protein